MTDRDSSSDGFLERWSRKKIEAEREAPDVPADPVAKNAPSSDEPSVLKQRAAEGAESPALATPKPEFDVTSLPSLESITATTDIRAFLSPGVPKELAGAALRRAWAADPSVRNFVGLAENAWDFTDPTAMPGFGPLPPGYDITKLVAQIFSGSEKPIVPETAADKPANPQATPIAEEIAPPPAPPEIVQLTGDKDEPISPQVSNDEQQVAQHDVVQRNSNIASHNGNSDNEIEARKNRRQHGGALPQ